MVKSGFSLAEALIVMLIISVLFSVGAKVMTKKPKPQKVTNPHGSFECYIDGATVKEANSREGVSFEPQDADGGVCRFSPPKGIAFFNINSYEYGFYNGTEPNMNQELEIMLQGDNFTIRSESGDKTFPDNAPDMNNDSAQRSAEAYFCSIHPNSNICNNRSYRQGVMISW